MSSNSNKIISLHELINAQVDAYKLELIMNEAPWVEVTTRLGRKCYSIATIQGIIDQHKLLADQELDNLRNAIEIAAAAGAGANGWIDKLVQTWSGRTQEQKNKENPSPFDFGANGDGVTSDTQAFIDLEAQYQGQIIDLLGRTYLVDKTPIKNQYVNGQFKAGNQASKSNVDRANESGFATLSIKQGEQSASLRYDLVRSSGNGSGNVIQSIAVDSVNRYIYTLTTHDFGGFVDRFNLDGTVRQNSQGRTDFLYGISGHQGLTVEYLDNKDTLLWTSAPYEMTDCVNYATVFRFEFREDGYPSEYECWKLADDGYTGNGSCTPTISLDQKYLFVRFLENGVCKIRGWDMDTIREVRLNPIITNETVTNPNNNIYTRTKKTFDISKRYCLEFDIKWSELDGWVDGLSHQDMVCDGKHIYIWAGQYYTDQDNFILKYDFIGNLVEQVKVNDVGRDDCIAIDTDYLATGRAFREFEGMALLPTKEGGVKLLAQVATAYGGTGNRRCFVYEFCGNAPVVSSNIITSSIQSEPNQQGIDIDKSNILLGGDGTTKSVTGVGNAKLQISSSDFSHGISLNRFSNTTGGSYLSFYKSRGAEVWGKDMREVQSGDYLGFINWLGNDGTDASKTTGYGVNSASINIRCVGTPTVGNVPSEICFSTSGDTGGATLRYTISSKGDFLPAGNNAHCLGSSTNIFKDLYIQNAPIVSSDERLKQQFRSLDEREKVAALEIKKSICMYKFNDAVNSKGDGARWHCGVKAQEVVRIMQNHGLNPFDYGFVCFDEWDEQDEIIESWNDECDDDGNLICEAGSQVTQEYREAGSRYAIRYDELSMFILSAI